MFKPIQIVDWIYCRKHGFMIEEPFLVLKTIYDGSTRQARAVVHFFSRPKKKSIRTYFSNQSLYFYFFTCQIAKKMFSYLQPIQNETLLYYLRKKIKAKLIGKSHNNVNSIRSSCHVNYIHTVCKFTKTLWRIIVLVMPFCNDF